jgi:HPt (histidine-containing phosphotransfer) domain-containing protein
MSDRPRTDALFERCKNKSNIECMAELEELCRTIEGELAQSKEANAGLMRVCENLERELAEEKAELKKYTTDNGIVSPRTDAAAMPIDRIDTIASRPCNVVHEDVCRQLERELAEAREALQKASTKGGSHE